MTIVSNSHNNIRPPYLKNYEKALKIIVTLIQFGKNIQTNANVCYIMQFIVYGINNCINAKIICILFNIFLKTKLLLYSVCIDIQIQRQIFAG